MFWNVILLEADKMFKRMMFRIELIILASLIVLVDVGEFLISRALPPAGAKVLTTTFTWPVGLVNGGAFADAHALGGILLIVLVGAVTSREYTWRTFHLWLSHGISRPMLLAAKFVISLVAILFLVLVSLLISSIITGILSFSIYGSLHIDQVNIGQLLLNFLVTAYSLLPYAALTFMLAIVSRSPILAIGGGLAFVFLIEGTVYTVLSFVGGVVTTIAQYLPVGLENALRLQSSRGLSLPAPWVATIGIAVYTLLFCGIAMWAFLRQNFTD